MVSGESFSLFSMNRSDLDCVLAMTFATVVNPVAARATNASSIFDDSVRIAAEPSSPTLNFAVPIPVRLGIVPSSIQPHANVRVSLRHSRVFLRYIQSYRNYLRTYLIVPVAILSPDPMFPILMLLLLVLRFVPGRQFPISTSLMVWIQPRPLLQTDSDRFYRQLVCRQCPDRRLFFFFKEKNSWLNSFLFIFQGREKYRYRTLTWYAIDVILILRISIVLYAC